MEPEYFQRPLSGSFSLNIRKSRPVSGTTAVASADETHRVMRGYSSAFPEEKLRNLTDEIKDFQLNNGSLLKMVFTDNEHTILARPIGVSLFPSPFPTVPFYRARSLQRLFNEVYANISEDEAWLYENTKDLMRTDHLAGTLWDIYSVVKAKGFVQDLSLGIFRSDYMINGLADPDSSSILKQVEFNTYSVAGGSHATKVARLHEQLALKGIYEGFWDDKACLIDGSSLVSNETIEALASALDIAHRAYGRAKSHRERKTAVLFVVQPNNVNICDERPIEDALWQFNTPIPAFRVEFGPEILARCYLGDNRELLFRPRHASSNSGQIIEISVAFLRAGLDPHEYTDEGTATRLLLAESRAINCPSILGHLATFKKVQQALSSCDALSRFTASDEHASQIKATFSPMYPLDESDLGKKGRQLATNPDASANFILKPSLEGGGHNVYGREIPDFLSKTPKDQWSSFILMKTIESPLFTNYLMSPTGLHAGPTTSELGIFGTCLWQRPKGPAADSNGKSRPSILENFTAGWSLKTKPADMSEMSVVKGYGCFDSLLLVDDFESFMREYQPVDSPEDDVEEGLAWYSGE